MYAKITPKMRWPVLSKIKDNKGFWIPWVDKSPKFNKNLKNGKMYIPKDLVRLELTLAF